MSQYGSASAQLAIIQAQSSADGYVKNWNISVLWGTVWVILAEK